MPGSDPHPPPSAAEVDRPGLSEIQRIPTEDDAEAPARRATLRDIAGAIFWGFFGVRKGAAMRRDAVTIKPHQVIIAGIVAAAILVATLIIVVRIITRAA